MHKNQLLDQPTVCSCCDPKTRLRFSGHAPPLLPATSYLPTEGGVANAERGLALGFQRQFLGFAISQRAIVFLAVFGAVCQNADRGGLEPGKLPSIGPPFGQRFALS